MTQQASPQAIAIQTDNQGLLKPTNLDEAWRLATAYAKSGILPDRYANKPEMVLCAMQMGLELGLKPLTALSKIAVVKGTPSVYGDLPLAMVMGSGLCEYIKEVYFDESGAEISMANKNLAAPVFGAVCIVKRKGDPEPREASFTMGEADYAGLTKLPSSGRAGAWQMYPKMMLKYRARSQALKDKFPDALNGIAIAEYDHNMSEGEAKGELIDVPLQAIPTEQKQAGRASLEEKLARKAQVIEVEDSKESDTVSQTPTNEVSNESN